MFTANQDREINKCHLRELKIKVNFCLYLSIIFPFLYFSFKHLSL